MLTSIQAQVLNLFGVADINKETGAFTPIVPIKYPKITVSENVIVGFNDDGTSDAYTLEGKKIFENKNAIIQKYGIVTTESDGLCNAYSNDGTCVVKRGFNLFFLANNLILISDRKNCYIFNYETGKLVSSQKFKSVLFFCGSNIQAQPYTPARDLSSLLENTDYLKYGAHLENLICAKTETGWGVLNASEKKNFSEFCYKVIVHCKGFNISAIDNKGNRIDLSTGN